MWCESDVAPGWMFQYPDSSACPAGYHIVSGPPYGGDAVFGFPWYWWVAAVALVAIVLFVFWSERRRRRYLGGDRFAAVAVGGAVLFASVLAGGVVVRPDLVVGALPGAVLCEWWDFGCHVSGFLGGIQGWFSGFGSGIQGWFGGVGKGVQDWFAGVGAWIQGIPAGIGGWFQGVWDSFAGMFASFFGAIGQLVLIVVVLVLVLVGVYAAYRVYRGRRMARDAEYRRIVERDEDRRFERQRLILRSMQHEGSRVQDGLGEAGDSLSGGAVGAGVRMVRGRR